MKKKIFFSVLLVLLLFAAFGAYWFWQIYYKPNVHTKGNKTEYLYVHTGTTMPELVLQLKQEKFVEDTSSFMMTAKLKKFTAPKPGRYHIKDGMDNRDLVNMLRAGLQEPINFSFNNIRTKEQLASRVGARLEADSAQFLLLLNDPGFLGKYGLNTETAMTLFIPNTYSLNWNTSEEQFFDRMAQEYKKFWNADRKAKAAALHMDQSEIVTLASIVEEEQMRYPDERPTIAGLYLNRLRIGMKLEADPTLKFALRDFSISRLNDQDKKVNSPYNTYMYAGLPPGPIRIPEIVSVDAVLNYKKSNYLFMCGEYGTGRNKFTADYNEHLRNASIYQAALNKANIRR